MQVMENAILKICPGPGKHVGLSGPIIYWGRMGLCFAAAAAAATAAGAPEASCDEEAYNCDGYNANAKEHHDLLRACGVEVKYG